jgi:hypothetical protein
MDDIGEQIYQWLCSIPKLLIIYLDFTPGKTLELIKKFGFLSNVTLGVGLLDSISVWKAQPEIVDSVLQQLRLAGNSKSTLQVTVKVHCKPTYTHSTIYDVNRC